MSNENRRHLLSTALAVLQPLFLSWITVVILSVFSYVLAASSPVLGETQWQEAAQFGTSAWLLALGAPLAVGDATIGMMPLLVTLWIALLCHRFLRRVPILDWVDVGLSALVGGATVGIIGLFALPGSFRLMAVLGGIVVTAVCALHAWWHHDPPRHTWWNHVRVGWPLLWPLLASFLAVAVLGLGWAVVAGWSRIVEITGYYVLGVGGTILLTMAQLLYLPNALVWAMAYIAGPGFAVGSGTSFSSLAVVSEPLPAIPVLGALPSPGTVMPWLIAVPIAIGLLVGLWRAASMATLARLAAYGGGASVVFLFLVALAGALSSGSIGPGRMSLMGVEPPLFAAILTLEACGGLLLGLLLRNPQLRRNLRRMREARRSRKREAAAAESARRDEQVAAGAEQVEGGAAMGGPESATSPNPAPRERPDDARGLPGADAARED